MTRMFGSGFRELFDWDSACMLAARLRLSADGDNLVQTLKREGNERTLTLHVATDIRRKSSSRRRQTEYGCYGDNGREEDAFRALGFEPPQMLWTAHNFVNNTLCP